MADEIVEGGNDTPSEGDLSQEREPSAGADSPGDQETPEDWKRRYLEAKSAEERANRLERELAAERAARQSPAAERQPAQGVDWGKVRNFAETGNPEDPAVEVARGQLVVGEALLQSARENKLRDDLDEIDDRAERKEVRKHIEAQREAGRSLDVEAAHNEVRARKLEAERDTLREALRRAEAGKRDPDERRVTSPREVPASQMKPREMSKDDFAAELDELPMHEAIKRQQDLMAGRIKLKK